MQASPYNFLFPDYHPDMPAGRPSRRKRSPFGDRLAASRQQAGLSQEEVAAKLGVTQRVITYWERDHAALHPEQFAALADLLGVTADYLVGRSETKKRGSGPTGKAKRLFEEISRLPRSQQEKLFAILEPFLAQHSPGRSRAA